jgi:formiminoglutamase
VRDTLAGSDADAIFWGFDMDAVRGADAPGVSAVNPLGLGADEFVGLWALAGSDPRTRVVELSEVNPRYDVDGRTARLAAVAVWSHLAALAG